VCQDNLAWDKERPAAMVVKSFELDPMLKRVCIQKKIRQSILFDGS
jgi:hypothetical protein